MFKKQTLLAGVLVLAVFSLGAVASEEKANAASCFVTPGAHALPEEWSHPSGFKFWLPDNWKVKEEDGVLIASGADSEIFFFVPKNSRSLDRALDEIDEELSAWMKNIKYDKPTTSNEGGIAEVFISGTGKDRETGEEVEFDLGIYEKKGKLMMVFGATSAENFDRYDKVFRKVVDSIK